MRVRCYGSRKKDHWYRENNIAICDQWRDNFKAFYDWSMANGYRDGLEIDRIDNLKGYYPDNCHYVSHIENARNKNTTKSVTYLQNNKPCATWEKALHHGKNTVLTRYDRGWNTEDLLLKKGGDKLDLYPYQCDLLIKSYDKSKVAYYYDMGLRFR